MSGRNAVVVVGLKRVESEGDGFCFQGESATGRKITVLANTLRPRGLKGKRAGANEYDAVAIIDNTNFTPPTVYEFPGHDD